MPDYYGTGRQPKNGKTHAGLVIALIAVLLVMNVVLFAILFSRQKEEPPERGMPPGDDERQEQKGFLLPREGGPLPPQQTAVCGMLICELDDAQQRYWDLPNGVIVGQVDENGTAAHAGILPGDVIVRIGGTTPDCAETCRRLLSSYHDGDTVKIGLYRSGEEIEIELTYSNGGTEGE